MNILITGITGFAGSHLAEYILGHSFSNELPLHKVYGIVRWRSRLENLQHLINNERLVLIEADLKDQTSVEEAIDISHPKCVFHLAAHSYVPTSWRMPNEVMVNNAGGQINLFEAVRTVMKKKDWPKMHLACSSEEYGLVKSNEVPIKEDSPLRPLSTYGVSKVAQDYLGYQYYKSYGMHIVRTRAFNHTGPRRGEVFICSTFAKQIAEIEAGLKEPVIKVGNLEAVRDFTDVRDTVRAYWLALQKGKAGEVYNIGTGRAYTMNDVLNLLLKISGIKVQITIDFERLRLSDVPILLCDNTKFTKQTGWKPEIEFEQTLTDLLNYWRKRLRDD